MSKNLPFATALIAWQKAAGRHELPWQNTRDPYRIWLSEIMLQQTQVTTVIPYYERFLATFPDVGALARAPVDAVLAHWAGLGYYARARNLHRCAQTITAVYAEKWPKSAAVLAELPGIGRSTAAAIAAFSAGERAAILDGNVKRVLCRHFGIEGYPGQAAIERKLWDLAEALLPDKGIEAYTQGMMDLGATVCTRRRPNCAACPLANSCLAHEQGNQERLPTPKPRSVIPERNSGFVLISDGERLLLERRPPSGLWGGLLVPPEGEAADVLSRLGLTALATQTLSPLKHTFTHFRLTLLPVLCSVAPTQACHDPSFNWVALTEAADAGVPTPIRKLIRQVASAAD